MDEATISKLYVGDAMPPAKRKKDTRRLPPNGDHNKPFQDGYSSYNWS